MNNKDFHISDVLSITTGRLVSSDGMNGIYNILNHMENDSLTTTGLTVVKDKHTATLDALYPQLSKNSLKMELQELDNSLNTTNNTEQTVSAWVKKLENRFGSYFSVPQQSVANDLDQVSSKITKPKF